MRLLAFFTLTVCLGFSCFSESQEKPLIEEKNTIKAAAVQAPKKNQHKKQSKSLLVGVEVRNYVYSEPGFVSHVGQFFGIWGEWHWSSFVGDGKVYGNFLYGLLTYDGALCDISNNCTPYSSKTTDYIAKINSRLELKLGQSFYLIAGLGYRYLYDRGEGVGFYTRRGNWIYLPLGAGFKSGKFLFDLEYDLIVNGNFKSNLSEVSSTFTDLTHTQKGYGLLLTIGYLLKENWNVHGIYESWNLEESDLAASGGAFFVEPKNKSEVFGLKVGYFF
ncbi:MAG: hypothetical protein AABY53_03795 [Bdellovibrionota bacterium]